MGTRCPPGWAPGCPSGWARPGCPRVGIPPSDAFSAWLSSSSSASRVRFRRRNRRDRAPRDMRRTRGLAGIGRLARFVVDASSRPNQPRKGAPASAGPTSARSPVRRHRTWLRCTSPRVGVTPSRHSTCRSRGSSERSVTAPAGMIDRQLDDVLRHRRALLSSAECRNGDDQLRLRVLVVLGNRLAATLRRHVADLGHRRHVLLGDCFQIFKGHRLQSPLHPWGGG
jgi:hypothetical protein